MGFCDKAQPAHESKIIKAELARIASLPETSAADTNGFASAPTG
jgi:hypothetical protein